MGSIRSPWPFFILIIKGPGLNKPGPFFLHNEVMRLSHGIKKQILRFTQDDKRGIVILKELATEESIFLKFGQEKHTWKAKIT